MAIIAVITIPIILNVIENSRKGAAIDSAYGYKDAVSKYYVSEMIDNQDLKLDGTYSVDKGTLKKGSETPIQIPTSGTSPTIGWIKIKDNEVTKGCLTIGDYKVELNDKDVTAEKGVCPENPPAFTVETRQTEGQLTVGDIVSIGEGETKQEFYVINPNGTDGKIYLLTRYNLNVGDNKNSNIEEGLQLAENSSTYGLVKFSSSQYWTCFNCDIYDSIKTHKGEPNGDEYSISYYVESYIIILKTMGEFNGDIEGRLLTKTEADNLNTDSNKFIIFSGQPYWLGSSASYTNTVWRVMSNDSFNFGSLSDAFFGVRPVIEISTSDIEL